MRPPPDLPRRLCPLTHDPRCDLKVNLLQYPAKVKHLSAEVISAPRGHGLDIKRGWEGVWGMDRKGKKIHPNSWVYKWETATRGQWSTDCTLNELDVSVIHGGKNQNKIAQGIDLHIWMVVYFKFISKMVMFETPNDLKHITLCRPSMSIQALHYVYLTWFKVYFTIFQLSTSTVTAIVCWNPIRHTFGGVNSILDWLVSGR